MKTVNFLFLFLALPTLTASANPLSFLKTEIQKDGYILYATPLASAGTGTLVGGKPNAMSIAADPQTCFPDTINGQSTLIRKVQDTTLGSISQTTSFDGTVAVDLLKFMNTANPIFNINAGFSTVSSVELSFEGAKIEYIDLILLEDFYKNHMRDDCKKMMNSVGFIIQALRVDKMKYEFKDSTGANIKLTMDGLSKYFNIDANIQYHIEQDYTLVIDTPKYIGYELGRLTEKDQGISLVRATSTFLNNYIFKSISNIGQ